MVFFLKKLNESMQIIGEKKIWKGRTNIVQKNMILNTTIKQSKLRKKESKRPN